MQRVVVPLILGLGSMVVFLVVGEVADALLGDIAALIVTGIVMLAYFFFCQFLLLSRGNPNALRKEWPSMLALGSGAIGVAFITALAEKREVFLTQGLGFLLVWFVGTFAGAVAASREARRKAEQKLS
jgi:cation transport ATPase